MQTSEWQTEKLSRSFLDGVRGAIPGADLQFTVIGKITEQWCPKPKSILTRLRRRRSRPLFAFAVPARPLHVCRFL